MEGFKSTGNHNASFCVFFLQTCQNHVWGKLDCVRWKVSRLKSNSSFVTKQYCLLNLAKIFRKSCYDIKWAWMPSKLSKGNVYHYILGIIVCNLLDIFNWMIWWTVVLLILRASTGNYKLKIPMQLVIHCNCKLYFAVRRTHTESITSGLSQLLTRVTNSDWLHRPRELLFLVSMKLLVHSAILSWACWHMMRPEWQLDDTS